jgi:hypothetical protein
MHRFAYLRAYMGGVALPTAFLLVALTIFCIARFVYRIPVPIERAIVFPMALVPNLFGAWNVLYLAVRRRRPWNIGLHGALLPFVIGPGGYVIGRLLGILDTSPNGFVYFHAVHVLFAHTALVFPVVVAAYYLIWKYIVGFFNRVLEIA